AEFADGEISRFRVSEVKAANARPGPHGETLGELDAGLPLRVEDLPERAFLGVVGARGITGRGTDAAVLFLGEVFLSQVLGLAKTPFLAGALVEILGECLGEPVRERFRHDRG